MKIDLLFAKKKINKVDIETNSIQPCKGQEQGHAVLHHHMPGCIGLRRTIDFGCTCDNSYAGLRLENFPRGGGGGSENRFSKNLRG